MARAYSLLKLDDFSGGLNIRDAPSEVGDTEASDCMNVTCDERGGIVKRLGKLKYNVTAIGPGQFTYAFFSEALGQMIVQNSTKLYATDGSGVFGASLKTFSSDDRIQAVDFLGSIVIIHPIDGCFVYNGTSVSAVSASPRGNVLAVWQNSIWSAGDSAAPTRLTRSDLGQITWPSTPVTVDIRDRDDKKVTAMAFSQGLDSQGRPGLLVFKDDSVHRVNDSSTGRYTTLSTDAGAAGPMCVTSLYGNTGFINRRGIYMTDGLSDPTLISGKLQPLFTPIQLNYATHNHWWAGSYLDRFLFSVTRTVSPDGNNDMLLEFHPSQGWIVPHDLRIACGATWTKGDQRLYTGGSGVGTMYETFRGWSDDTNPIASRWQSRWFETTGGYEMRYRRLIVSGRGNFDLYVKHNYTLGQGILCPVSLLSGAEFGSWNDDNWNEFTWGPGGYEDYQWFYSLGHSRSVALQIKESSTSSATGPSLLGDGAGAEVGAFAMYGLHLDIVPLTPA